jgi:hypothetical protein
MQINGGETIGLVPTKEHKYTLIFLHGLGDTAEGFYDYFLDDDRP